MMRVNLGVFGLSAYLLAVSPVIAQDHEPAVNMGPGVGTCNQFIHYYRIDSQIYEVVYFSWAQGDMSGFNGMSHANNKPVRDLNSIPTEIQESFLREYCNQHPLAQYSDGVIKLYERMPIMPIPVNGKF